MSKYYLIAGEASGDLHASQLVRALLSADPQAQFRGIGGDYMQAAGVSLLAHYRDLAYMGFVQVALHLPQILRHLRQCQSDLQTWQADALILVDYPGFNLRMAKFAFEQALCPVYYYISPKIWAWKEGRIKQIRRYVTQMFSILPFEVDYFAQRHGYAVQYVGNPTWEEVQAYQAQQPPKANTHAVGKRILALLPGSRLAEIRANLPLMLQTITDHALHQRHKICIAAAPGIDRAIYTQIAQKAQLRLTVCQQLDASKQASVSQQDAVLFVGESFALLHQAHAALVTSGTATLETALFGVPQVVCYAMRGGRIVNCLRPYLLKVPFISLPNLIVGKAILPELVAGEMHAAGLAQHLLPLLTDSPERQAQLQGYAQLYHILGEQKAALTTARSIVAALR